LPLNVTLAINEKPIQHIRISRLETLRSKGRLYPYRVESEGLIREVAFFTHRYSDGAEICLSRALEALAMKRKEDGHDDVPQPQG
jgi:hypothetical protein